MGLSIIGGSDHSCVPFGTGDPGIFISKVRQYTITISDNSWNYTQLHLTNITF